MDSSAPTQEGSPFVGGRIQRGTGSARRPVAHAVGVAELTPPPDPRKTDREAIARRRAAQIEAALDLARRSLQQEELDEALDACQQALTLDDVHTVALELEQTIKLAIARRRAGELVADARDELAKGAITAAQSLLQQARALDPETPEAKRVERDLKLARIEQERLRQRGSLVIDAVPWATITAIQGLDGASQPLPSPASTPVVLRLPIGTYRIGVAGPPPASESRLLTVQVQEGVATSAPSERFETLTPEMYFEEYLTVSNPTAGAPDAPPAATPPSPPSPEKMP